MKLILWLFSCAVLLTSCSTGTPELAGLSPQAQAEIIKNHGGIYKVGNPYKIAGKWYYPKEDYGYTEVGMASWYGEDFNGKATANGERYNMNTLTAAHRTLPLPSIVRVTNLQNGRSIILRVNDRGPYVKNRIIDLSKRGAQLLGYMGQGVTKVKVEVMEKESRALKAALLNTPLPEGTALAEVTAPAHSLYESSEERMKVASELEKDSEIYAGNGDKSYTYNMYHPISDTAAYGSATAKNVAGKSATLGAVEGYVKEDGGNYGQSNSNNAVSDETYKYLSDHYYLHAGSYSQYDLAQKMMSRVKEHGSSRIVEVDVGGKHFYRVSVGPYKRMEEAKVAQAKLKYHGINDTRIEKTKGE